MTTPAVYTSLKAVGYVVILSMAATLFFAAYVAVEHWSGIGV